MTCKVAIIGVLLSDKDNLRYNTEKFCKKVQVLTNLNCNCIVLFLLVQGRKYFLYNEEMLLKNNPSMTQIFTVEIQVVHILLLAIPFLPTSPVNTQSLTSYWPQAGNKERDNESESTWGRQEGHLKNMKNKTAKFLIVKQKNSLGFISLNHLYSKCAGILGDKAM